MPVIRESLVQKLYQPGIGQELWDFANGIYPICRSISGNGVRETLGHIKEKIDLQIHEVPSGTQAFDWTIAPEWNIRDAWIKDPQGKKIIDFKKHNLHVLNYSGPINGKFQLSELRKHIFTMPDQPDLIPYRTSISTRPPSQPPLNARAAVSILRKPVSPKERPPSHRTSTTPSLHPASGCDTQSAPAWTAITFWPSR